MKPLTIEQRDEIILTVDNIRFYDHEEKRLLMDWVDVNTERECIECGGKGWYFAPKIPMGMTTKHNCPNCGDK